MSSAQSHGTRRRCGPYVLEDVIGMGAQGAVYRAVRDGVGPGQQFVVKVLSAGAYATPDEKRACLREAEILARLNHPTIVSPIEASPDDPEGGWIAMEYVDGTNLRMLLQSLPERRLSPQLAILIAIEVCKAFVACHELPIVHRDIKSANVLIGSGGFVKLADFGVARFMRAYREPETAPGGTLQYMAPEQAKGGVADERSDLFSLGVVMYEMLAGCLPVHGVPDLEIAERLRSGSYPKLLEVNPAVPQALADIVTCLMQPKPQRRYQTARALLHAFNQIVKGAAVAGTCTATAPCVRKPTSELFVDVDLCLELGKLARAARRHLTLDPEAVLRDYRLAQAALMEQALPEHPAPAATASRRASAATHGPTGDHHVPVDDATLVGVEQRPRMSGTTQWLRHRGLRAAAATAVAAVAVPLGFAGTSHLQSDDGWHAPSSSKVAPSSLLAPVVGELGAPVPSDHRAVDSTLASLASLASKTPPPAPPAQSDVQATETHEPEPVAQAPLKPTPAPKKPDKQAAHTDRGEAKLTIGAMPSANVWIDGKNHGLSPAQDVPVKAGRHCIGVGEAAPKKETCKWIRVSDGEHLEILFEDQVLASVDRHGR